MRTLAFVLLSGCLAPTTQLETFEMQPILPTPLDVLVVLDDTTAMTSHLPRVPPPEQLGILDLIYNGAPDLRIAVTTTTTGTLRVSDAVPTGVIVHARNFEDGTMTTNYEGTLASAASSLMNVGTASTSPNAVLASTRRALDTDGFVRASSGLGILIDTASDDQSPDDVSVYAGATLARGNPVLVSTVNADPVPRVAAFADAFPYRRFTPMSSYNMEALSIFSWLFANVTIDDCLPIAAADVDPETDGDQFDCQMFTSHDHVVHPLPSCSSSPGEAADPCWQIVAYASCSSGRALVLGGGYGMYRPRILGRCATR